MNFNWILCVLYKAQLVNSSLLINEFNKMEVIYSIASLIQLFPIFSINNHVDIFFIHVPMVRKKQFRMYLRYFIIHTGQFVYQSHLHALNQQDYARQEQKYYGFLHLGIMYSKQYILQYFVIKQKYQYMEPQDPRVNIFVKQMKVIRPEELTNILRCPLCNGLYRFAHTLIECGHTFCQQCIFAYIRGFKGRNPEVKCPQCHTLIQAKYERSIIKDVFKQSLVDVLEPSYSLQQKVIISRVQQLFPEFNLNFLLQEFNFITCTKHPQIVQSSRIRKNKQQKSIIMSKLPTVVKQKLGVNFEAFTQMLLQDRHFNKFLEIIKKYNQDRKIILNLRPKTQRDFMFVGVNNKIRTGISTVPKIRKYLEKKLLIKLQNSQEFSKELINPDSERLQIRIELFLNNNKLQDEYNLMELIQGGQSLIQYSLI